jgi:competence protein CoiA
MQLVALEQTRPVLAAHALKGQEYTCPECRLPLKVRSGPHRQTHFYHLSRPTRCKQHQKSIEHLHLQLYLAALRSDAEIECPFPEIGRIADVVWKEEKLVFEVQCSPISQEEAMSRIQDYNSVGYEVIWLLHERSFNKLRLSAAEECLRERGCYFTNIDKLGKGEIYDQFEILKAGRRLFKGPPLEVQISTITSLPPIPDLSLPQQAVKRVKGWVRFTGGDLLFRLLHTPNAEAAAHQMARLENRLLIEKRGEKRLPLISLLKAAYRHVFESFLKDRCC